MTGSDLVQLPDPTSAELAGDPARYVVEACERAKAWLANALEHGDIEQIVELKSQAEAIRVYTRQKELGKDAELSAAEIVRRAERGIGVAIRKGQEAGEIASAKELKVRAGQIRQGQRLHDKELLPTPSSFVEPQEFTNNGAGIWHLTDGISDDEFDAAVTEAKAEGNLSRANVVRKVRGLAALDDPDWIPDRGDSSQAAALRRRELIREMASGGYSSEQIGQRVNMLSGTVREIAKKSGVTITADVTMGVASRTRTRVDSNRIVRETVSQLEGLDVALQLVIFEELDRSEAVDWTTSLTESIRVLNRLNKKLREMVQ